MSHCPGGAFCLHFIVGKGTRLVKELVLSLTVYLLGLVAMYALDIVTILANGLLIIKSFAASFDMRVDIVFPRITLDLTLPLPSWLHWFPRICHQAINSFERVFSKVQFRTIALQNMQVTCLGAQAPGEVSVWIPSDCKLRPSLGKWTLICKLIPLSQVFSNLIIVTLVFMLFEVHFLEVRLCKKSSLYLPINYAH